MPKVIVYPDSIPHSNNNTHIRKGESLTGEPNTKSRKLKETPTTTKVTIHMITSKGFMRQDEQYYKHSNKYNQQYAPPKLKGQATQPKEKI